MADLPAVSCGPTVRTWAEIERRSARLAGYLLAAGLVPGDRVGIGMRNSVEHVEAYFALFQAGLTPVNLNVRYQSAEMRHLLTDSGAKALIVHASVAPIAAEAAVGTDAAGVVVVVADSVDDSADVLADRPSRFVGYASVLAESEPLPYRPGDGEEQIIVYTGGTTGAPKGTVWSHHATMGIATGAYRSRGFEPPTELDVALDIATEVGRGTPRPVLLPASPLMHGTGFFGALAGLAIGGEVALLPGGPFSAAVLWQTVVNRRVTEIVITGDVLCAPMLDELRRAADAGTPYDLSSLRVVRSAGMRWSSENKVALLEFADVQLIDVIASSEGGPFGISTTSRGDTPETARFVLSPDARVLTEDYTDVVPGSGVVGLLASPNRMPVGYLGDAAATDKTFPVIDGVRYAIPGDRALLNADGSLTLLGRESGVINSGGEKIDAEEVENVLVQHPAVADAVVVGVPDPRWGQSAAAIVAVRPGASVTGEELIEHVRGQLAGYKKPSRVLFVDELVRTGAGKPDRRWAQAYAAS